MNKRLLEDFAELKRQEKLIASQLKLIYEAVEKETIQVCEQLGTRGFVLPGKGTYKLVKSRKVWTYSDKVTGLQDELVELKKTEEQIGIATFEQYDEMRFTYDEKAGEKRESDTE